MLHPSEYIRCSISLEIIWIYLPISICLIAKSTKYTAIFMSSLYFKLFRNHLPFDMLKL